MAAEHYHGQRAMLLALLCLADLRSAPPANAFELALPVDCIIGKSCVIQNYVDHDPSADFRDFRCGSLAYDGHTGTDFRLPDLASQRRGVNVLAAASGTVIRLRDDMPDVVFSAQSAPLVKGRECGNGVVLEHGDGWQTQYCHMARGSIRVKIGERVEKGDPIGSIGLSGKTEFPHLHLTVRQNGKVVDPFAFGALPETCGGGDSLWMSNLQLPLSYRSRHVLNSGFAPRPVSMEQIESGELNQSFSPTEADALVAYVRVVGLKAGDSQRLVLKYRNGQLIADGSDKGVDRPKAQYMMFAGRKRPAAGWSESGFIASYTIENNGQTVLTHDFELVAR